jgi:FtsZ-binding cell division protein ZapB
MEEQKKKRTFWSWVKDNRMTVGVGLISLVGMIAEGYCLLKANEKLGNLEKENQSLKNENADLQGQIRATEKENRHLTHELNNAWYQNGKDKANRERN